MKTHDAIEQPKNLEENPQPLALANFILWKFLQMPAGGLFAKWNDDEGKATWYYSAERDYLFRKPKCELVIYEEKDRARFRSLVFRFGSLADEGLCGTFEFKGSAVGNRRYVVHSSFHTDSGIGLWVAITSIDSTARIM